MNNNKKQLILLMFLVVTFFGSSTNVSAEHGQSIFASVEEQQQQQQQQQESSNNSSTSTTVIKLYRSKGSTTSRNNNNSNNNDTLTVDTDDTSAVSSTVVTIYKATGSNGNSNSTTTSSKNETKNIINDYNNELQNWNHTVECTTQNDMESDHQLLIIDVPFQYQIISNKNVSVEDIRDFKTLMIDDLSQEFLMNDCSPKYIYEETVDGIHFADYNSEHVYSITTDPITGKTTVKVYRDDRNKNNSSSQRRNLRENAVQDKSRDFDLRQLTATDVTSEDILIRINGFHTNKESDILVSEGKCSNNDQNNMMCSIFNSTIQVAVSVIAQDIATTITTVEKSTTINTSTIESLVKHLILDGIEFFMLKGMYNEKQVNDNINSVQFLSQLKDESEPTPEPPSTPTNTRRTLFFVGFGVGISSVVGVMIIIGLWVYICKSSKNRLVAAQKSYSNNDQPQKEYDDIEEGITYYNEKHNKNLDDTFKIQNTIAKNDEEYVQTVSSKITGKEDNIMMKEDNHDDDEEETSSSQNSYTHSTSDNSSLSGSNTREDVHHDDADASVVPDVIDNLFKDQEEEEEEEQTLTSLKQQKQDEDGSKEQSTKAIIQVTSDKVIAVDEFHIDDLELSCSSNK